MAAGGARVVLRPPLSLGNGAAHQVLKVGDADQTRTESWFFNRIARDFGYVTRPAAQGAKLYIANYGEVAAHGCYYPRIHPINMAPGSFRKFSENDMLVLCAIISHLGLMYLRVADVGGHNVGWQVASLAYDAQTNLARQGERLQNFPYVPLVLYDAGRWQVATGQHFPGQQRLKGFWGMIAKFPELNLWFTNAVKSHYLQGLARLVLHRLSVCSPSHWEGCKDFQMVQYTPLTYRQGLVIPSTNPWEHNSDEGVTWAIVPIGSPYTPAN